MVARGVTTVGQVRSKIKELIQTTFNVDLRTNDRAKEVFKFSIKTISFADIGEPVTTLDFAKDQAI